ncbi:hypothetical protein BDF22DRAFT_643382 [Syncephalis plumigaleata]|nr:hypothetical protein BDF22DRAFT_643382 [Syncephalis plumigaleata]
MSLEVFWDKLDREVALMAQELLNSRFRSAPKPDVIGDLVCTHLDFGSQSPEIEIVDVTDPFPEFYLPDPHILAGSVHSTPTVDEEEPHIYGYDPDQDDHQLYPTTSYNEEVTDTTHSHQHNSNHGNNDYRKVNHINRNPSLESNNSNGNSNSKVATMLGPEKRDTDVQLQVRVSYEGNLQLTIATELRLNFPSMSFLSLPIELTVTSFSFSGTAVIAYLHDRVNFCFLEPEEKGQSLIKDLRVESQIGDARKHVLKNVGKVERFVVDLLRQIVDQDLVFPCYSSVDLVGPEPHHEQEEKRMKRMKKRRRRRREEEIPMEMVAPHPDILLYGHYAESPDEMPHRPLSHTSTPLAMLTSPLNGSPIIDPDAVDD